MRRATVLASHCAAPEGSAAAAPASGGEGFESLDYKVDGHVAIVTLNRPKSLNALNAGLRRSVLKVCAEVARDDNVRAVVFTGSGKGFCSGADVSGPPPAGAAKPSQNARLDDMGWVGDQAKAIYNIGKPSIAAVNGVAAGAGMSLALGCDMRVGTEKSRFRSMFVERSLSPDSGMSFFLPRIVGQSRAADLIYTSRDVPGAEAYRLGLLDRLVAPDALLTEAVGVARQMCAHPPIAVRAAKRVLQQNIEAPSLEAALRNETYHLLVARRAPNDVKEQMAAFRQKRKPTFTGT